MFMENSGAPSAIEIGRTIGQTGYAACPRATMLSLIGWPALDEWASFAASWDDLAQDSYMADGGRYRRRRFAAFAVRGEKVVRKPLQPHYQSRDHNRLNGGINRWFEPVDDLIAVHIVTRRIFAVSTRLFDRTTTGRSGPKTWHVEMHQFRIEANNVHAGYPTPEGIHRDGVAWVCMTLVNRQNVSGGASKIHCRRGPLDTLTLAEPLDTLFVDDERILHAVTPVYALNPDSRAFRDVLVLTFRGDTSRAETRPGRRHGLKSD